MATFSLINLSLTLSSALIFFLAAASIAGVAAQTTATTWGACGVATMCEPGSFCTSKNPFYSQCIPGTAPSAEAMSSTLASPSPASSTTSTGTAAPPTFTSLSHTSSILSHTDLSSTSSSSHLTTNFQEPSASSHAIASTHFIPTTVTKTKITGSSSKTSGGSSQAQSDAIKTSKSFFQEQAAVAGVFTAVGLITITVTVAAILAYLKLLRRRFARIGERRVRGRFRRRWVQIITPLSSTFDTTLASESTTELGGASNEGLPSPTVTDRDTQEEVDLPGPPPTYSSLPSDMHGPSSDTASEVAVSEALATTSPTSPGGDMEKVGYH